MSDSVALQIVGGLFMLISVVLFVMDRKHARTSRKDISTTDSMNVLGQSFTVSTPSLVFFIVGAAIFVFPFTPAYSPHVDSPVANPNSATTANSDEEKAATLPVLPQSSSTDSAKSSSDIAETIPNFPTADHWTVNIFTCGFPREKISEFEAIVRNTVGAPNVTVQDMKWTVTPESNVEYFYEYDNRAAEMLSDLARRTVDLPVKSEKNPTHPELENYISISFVGSGCSTIAK